ncbi:MAG: hypothetical protein QM534_02770 [Sediminibacterium sp.]|nr:hypothetical protein [Sediminibacterium sp.]
MLQDPVVKVAEKPVIPFDQLKIKSQFSLAEARNGAGNGQGTPTPQQQEKAENSYQNIPFGINELKNAIAKYAADQLQLGNRMLHVTLTTCGIDLQNESELILTIINEAQNEKLQTVKQDFLDEIRKTIQNNTLTLTVKLSEAEATVKAFKPSDKFKQLAEKYPALLELKKRFDLEIDY